MISDFFSKQAKMYSQLIADMRLKESFYAIKNFDWNGYYLEMKDKLQNLSRTNYELALYHLATNHLSDAKLRFRIARYLDKDNKYTDTDYYIGLCYYQEFKYEQAKKHLQLHLSQDNPSYAEESDFCLKVADNRLSEITHVPAALISYKADQAAGLHIPAPTSIQQGLLRQVNSYLQLNSKPFGNNILDLGCGTGTIGFLARQLKLASFISGVDISQSMLKIAQGGKVDGVDAYNAVINANIADYITTTNHHDFDVIFADDSLGSLSQIEETLLSLGKLISAKGVIAISIRTTDQEKPLFNPFAQQFMFNQEHLAKTAAQAKLQIFFQEKVSFPNGDAGALMLLVKA